MAEQNFTEQRFSAHEYHQTLNAWHLELSILRDMVVHVLDEVDTQCEPGLSACAYFAKDRFEYLIESFPFPPPVA